MCDEPFSAVMVCLIRRGCLCLRTTRLLDMERQIVKLYVYTLKKLAAQIELEIASSPPLAERTEIH